MFSNAAFITFAVCFIALGCSGESSTPQRWQQSVKAGNKTYFLFNQPLTLIEADIQCRQEKMKLLSIENEAEYRDLVAKINEFDTGNPLYVWSSGTLNSDGTWLWLSTREPITFFDWVGDFEPEPGMDCINLNFNFYPKGTYTTTACSTPSNFICEL
ncbi:unnamed protein product [Phyllotreta striolata]|uniref:C-type lectin domain-containing protein n=1 Tax=Phyllotreta striolata TaxID=444603 RepID=A0A9N9TQA2_PHYSR|nr:unnamed protein product [Phyllotreta striolata]